MPCRAVARQPRSWRRLRTLRDDTARSTGTTRLASRGNGGAPLALSPAARFPPQQLRRDGEIQAVEEQLVGAVRLRAEQDLRRDREDAALLDACLDDPGAIRQVVLPPRPPAAQRLAVGEPGDAAHAFGRG